MLCHPFYRAWAAGELTREDLREYARHYYHHVQAFPCYLAEFALRLDEGELQARGAGQHVRREGRRGKSGKDAVPHSELWLDFAEGMGARRDMHWHLPVKQIGELMRYFHSVASEGTAEEALAAFYVYESQVPRSGQGKRTRAARNVRRRRQDLRLFRAARHRRCLTTRMCGASNWRSAWRQNRRRRQAALDAAENAARMLWQALDGIEAARMTCAV